MISYPKSGGTWLAFMILNYIELSGSKKRDVYSHNSTFNFMRLPNGKMLRMHHDCGHWVPIPLKAGELSFSVQKYLGKKVIFLARDPRDILVSSWYHLKFKDNFYPGTISEIIRDDLVGIRKIIAFMNMWIENSHVPEEFMLVTYEDMRSDTQNIFRKVCSFLGLKIDESAIKDAVADSSFEKMKAAEKNKVLWDPWETKKTSRGDDSMKVRKGKIGGYKEELPPEDLHFVDDAVEKFLSPKLPYKVRPNPA
ncbi:hypothetical protein UR09_05260 [Candidatus Nitromaritima sp. SCGC AAA799-A02]|nr:hypothetical protein UR09_05260 [Candidatus Nitromaritima sp. SCGC AAA799-A02]